MNSIAQSACVYVSLIGGGYALWLLCDCHGRRKTDDRETGKPVTESTFGRLEKVCELIVAIVLLVSASGTILTILSRFSPTGDCDGSLNQQASIAGMQAVPSGRLYYASDRQGCPLIGADLSGLSVSDDEVLALLHHSEDLQWLILQYTNVSDDCLPAIGQLPHLTNLNLAHTRITNAGLRHLTSLQELEDLSLCGTSIDDSGLADISSMKSVRSLSLEGTGITDASLASLSSLDLLQNLCVIDTQMSPTALTQLIEQLPDVACYYGAPHGKTDTSNVD